MTDLQGWLNIYKPINISSFAVLKKIKKKFNIQKIGHAGTLDPLAEGILPVAIGKTTKLIPYISDCEKEYEFEIKWGEQTTTDDAEGEIINRSDKIPTNSEINNQFKYFKGVIKQTPPMASAVKINGKRAYKLLREKKIFKINEKDVEVFGIELVSNNQFTAKFKIICGKGFYIRSFARDISEKLNTKGHIFSLKRTKVGSFSLNSSNLLDDLLKIGQTLSEFKGFHSSVSMLDDILAYEIDDERDVKDLSMGRSITIDKNKLFTTSLNSLDGKIVFLTRKGNVFSLGKLNGNLFKPDKVLI